MSDETAPEPVTPAELRAAAAAAAALEERIRGIQARLRATGGEVSRAGYRLDDAAGEAKRVASELEKTAEDLARLRSRPTNACEAPWGVCPEHGETLRSTGGETRCMRAGCGRTWGYDRLTRPCTEPAVFRLSFAADPPGTSTIVCAGHAIAVRERGEGVTLAPIG